MQLPSKLYSSAKFMSKCWYHVGTNCSLDHLCSCSLSLIGSLGPSNSASGDCASIDPFDGTAVVGAPVGVDLNVRGRFSPNCSLDLPNQVALYVILGVFALRRKSRFSSQREYSQ